VAEVNDPTGNAVIPDRALGTVLYMGPERFAKYERGTSRKVDRRSDIYSVGCAMFETLTGSLPFDSDDVTAVINMHRVSPIPTLKERTGAEFPLELEAVIQKCLAKEPSARYQSAGDLRSDLIAVLNHQPIRFADAELRKNRGESLGERVPTRGKQSASASVVAVIAILLVGFVGFVGFVLMQILGPRSDTPQEPQSKPLRSEGDLEFFSHVNPSKESPDSFTRNGWLCDVKGHPRLGDCKMLIAGRNGENGSAIIKFFNDKECEQITEDRFWADKELFPIKSLDSGGGEAALNETLTKRREAMYGGTVVEPYPGEVIDGINCLRFKFTDKHTGLTGFVWSTQSIKVPMHVASRVCLACDFPPIPEPAGLPVKLEVETPPRKSAIGPKNFRILGAKKVSVPIRLFQLKNDTDASEIKLLHK